MYLGAALAGAAIALAADRAMVPGAAREDKRSPRERYFDQLQLTAAQRDTATAIFDERNRKFKALMDQQKAILDPLRAAQDSLENEWRQRFTQLLTPEQRAIYDQMQSERRERDRAARGGDRR